MAFLKGFRYFWPIIWPIAWPIYGARIREGFIGRWGKWWAV